MKMQQSTTTDGIVMAACNQLRALMAAGDLIVSESLIYQLGVAGEIPRPEKGKWPVVKTLVALCRYWRKGTSESKKAVTDERKEGYRLENKLRRMKIEEKERTLVPIDAVSYVWRFTAEDIAARIRASAFPEQFKDDLLKSLSALTPDKYFEDEDSRES